MEWISNSDSITCSSRFVTQWELVNHENSVHGEKTYKWDECGQGLARRDSLVDQLNSHVGNKTHPCMCGKMYTYASGVSRHKRTCKVVKQLC